ncbi:hypothetical protein GGX14DRAFT_427433 [Mycena pura]|uniref:TEA domain-containing protein n=1 Tax=Mycena pura TaxID=153505 RepID=A0AAD6YMD9_9AGAR|nr:hypothetical protein GGX14DRAFT_427433 [Mycena pura]
MYASSTELARHVHAPTMPQHHRRHAPVPLSPPSPRAHRTACSARAKDVEQRLLTAVLQSRKLYKTQDSGRAIWPLPLEAALVEGLVRFRPQASRETLMLGRFPGRNQFIARHIAVRTGQWRSPKQVSSRLQQLRESCANDELGQLLFAAGGCKQTADAGADAGRVLGDSGARGYSPAPVPAPTPPMPTPEIPRRVICIDIVPRGQPAPARGMLPPALPSDGAIHISAHPRSLACIDPTVAFVARAPVGAGAQSRFRVCCGGEPVHAERVPLELVGGAVPRPDAAALLYRTQLIPGYWHNIVASSDPTRYTIYHDVDVTGTGGACAVAFAAVYRFSHPPEAHAAPAYAPANAGGLGTSSGHANSQWA